MVSPPWCTLLFHLVHLEVNFFMVMRAIKYKN